MKNTGSSEKSKNIHKLNQCNLIDYEELKIIEVDSNDQRKVDENMKNSEKIGCLLTPNSFPVEKPNLIGSKENSLIKPTPEKTPYKSKGNKSEDCFLQNITIKLKDINNINDTFVTGSTDLKEISIPNQKIQFFSNLIQQKVSKKPSHKKNETAYENENISVEEVAEESNPSLFNEETFIYIDKNLKNCNILGKGLYVSNFKN